MKTVLVPTNHRKMIMVFVGDYRHVPSEDELHAINDWIARNQQNWPENFCDLQKKFQAFPLRLEVLHAKPDDQKYVMAIEHDYYVPSADSFENLFADISEDTPTFTVNGDMFTSVKRINRILVPFL